MTFQADRLGLSTLVGNGLLQEVKASRENLYINLALLALLTEREPAQIGR